MIGIMKTKKNFKNVLEIVLTLPSCNLLNYVITPCDVSKKLGLSLYSTAEKVINFKDLSKLRNFLRDYTKIQGEPPTTTGKVFASKLTFDSAENMEEFITSTLSQLNNLVETFTITQQVQIILNNLSDFRDLSRLCYQKIIDNDGRVTESDGLKRLYKKIEVIKENVGYEKIRKVDDRSFKNKRE